MPGAYPNPPRQALPEPPASPPAILAAGGLELPSLAGTAGAHVDGQILLGVMVTAVAAYLFVRFLLRSFQTRALTPFAIYCLALGHSASSASPYDPGQAPDRDRGSGGAGRARRGPPWIRADPRRRGHRHLRQRAARLARRAGVRHRFPGR